MRAFGKIAKRGLTVIGVLTLVASFYYYGWGPCGKTVVRDTAKVYSRVLADWQVAVDEVPQIPRQAMAAHHANMVGLRDKLEGASAPECMSLWRQQMLDQMDERLADLHGFANGDNGISIDTHRLKSMRVRLASFMSCAPKCSAKVVGGDPDTLNRIVHLKTRGGGK